MTELEKLKEGLQEEIKTYHETKGVVSEFAEAEKERTQQKVADLQENTQKLTADKANIRESKQLLEEKLNEIEEQITGLETRRLPELKNKITEIERQDTDQGMAQFKYASELDSMNAALAESGEKFEKETENLSYEQFLLSEQAEQSQEERSRTTKKAVIIISAVILIFLFMLYFIGRIRRRKLLKS